METGSRGRGGCNSFGGVGRRYRAEPAAVEPRAADAVPLVLPEDATFFRTAAHLLAISPDGTKLAYVTKRQMFLRRMSEMEPRPVPGVAGDVSGPFFSPDGEWLGFVSYQDSLLKKVRLDGGAAVTLCKASNLTFGASWLGNSIVFEDPVRGIMRVSTDGGEPEVVVPIKPEEGTASSPQLLDDGKTILFTLAPRGIGAERWDKAQIFVHSIGSGTRKVLIAGGSDARYVKSGHIVYRLGANILAMPFDVNTLQTKSGPVPVIENVMHASVVSGNAQLSISDSGTLVYIPSDLDASAGPRRLAFADGNGKLQPLPLSPGPYETPRLSPDGKQLAVRTDNGNEQIIWIYNLVSGGATLRRLTFGPHARGPLWSPDGRYVFYASEADGANPVWSHDGKQLFYSAIGDERVVAVNIQTEPRFSAGAASPVPLPRTGQSLALFVFLRRYDVAPDGKFIGVTAASVGDKQPPPQINVAINWLEELKQRVPVK